MDRDRFLRLGLLGLEIPLWVRMRHALLLRRDRDHRLRERRRGIGDDLQGLLLLVLGHHLRVLLLAALLGRRLLRGPALLRLRLGLL